MDFVLSSHTAGNIYDLTQSNMDAMISAIEYLGECSEEVCQMLDKALIREENAKEIWRDWELMAKQLADECRRLEARLTCV